MAATLELCRRQATAETVSSLRLRTGVTRMKSISVVLFPPFSVARNRVMAPLLMSCSFQLQSQSRFFPNVMSAAFASKRLGAKTVIGDSGASRHTFGDNTHVRKKRLPAAEEAYFIIGDGERLPVACFRDLDLVLHCERNGKPWNNVRVTLKNVSVVPGI